MRTMVLICAIILAAVAGIWLWRSKRSRMNDEPRSIVLLLLRPKPLSAQVLADVLSKVTLRSVRAMEVAEARKEEDDNQPVGDMVAGESPHFIAHVGGTTFLINTVSVPYTGNPARASESIPESRLRKAIGEHKAWLSMDILHPEAATPDAYRIVGRVLANLIDSDCLALYHPPLNLFAPCSLDRTVTKLSSNDPIKAVFQEVTEAPVFSIDGDPRLMAAEAEARRRFSEFETAFRNQDGRDFAIKTAISRDGKSEHIWVEVDRILAGKIEGRLANDPVDLPGLVIGSKVEIKPSRVEDWVFVRKGAPVGMFTVPVIQQIEHERALKK